MVSSGCFSLSGTGDSHRGRAHLVYDVQDRLFGGREPVQGPRGNAGVLLPRAGSQVFGVFSDWAALQDQAHIKGTRLWPVLHRL